MKEKEKKKLIKKGLIYLSLTGILSYSSYKIIKQREKIKYLKNSNDELKKKLARKRVSEKALIYSLGRARSINREGGKV